MEKVKPISPDELIAQKKKEFPSIVIKVVNRLLKEKWDGKEARIMQDDIIKYIVQNSNYTKNEIFDKHLLDFEDVYRDQGWKVTYDSPAYCETYDAYFLFERASKSDGIKKGLRINIG